MTAIRTEDLPTVYDPKETEESIYKFWENGEYFKADAKSKKPSYSIVIPPPNVTGVLHMGHALDETLQDILTRYHRMAGFAKKVCHDMIWDVKNFLKKHGNGLMSINLQF